MFDQIQAEITLLLQEVNNYVSNVVGGNEFASGMILAGILGSATFLMKSWPLKIYSFIKKHTTTTLNLNSTSESFHLMMKYFELKGLSSQARSIRVNNGLYDDGDIIKGIGYGQQVFWFKGRPLLIDVSKEQSVGNQVKEFITIKKMGRSHKLFDDLINDVKESKDDTKTGYYQYDYGKDHLVDQPKQSIDNVILKADIKHEIVEALNNFVKSEDWYIKHNIPYQLGILLYGPPGTGKTTLVRAIAGYMNKDVVMVSGVDNLAKCALKVSDSVIVVDEVDTFGMAKRKEARPLAEDIEGTEDDNDKSNPIDDLKKVGLAKVLTSLDGVISNHGRIVIMCTNHPDTLDSAMIRPGRIDIKLEIGYLSNETCGMMLDKFFGKSDRTLTIKDGVSPADIQNDVIMGLSESELIEKYEK